MTAGWGWGRELPPRIPRTEHKDTRLRVVYNFGDGDCEAGEIHTRARKISRRRDVRGAPKMFWHSPRVARVTSPRNFARVCGPLWPAQQSPSTKLETTQSLRKHWIDDLLFVTSVAQLNVSTM